MTGTVPGTLFTLLSAAGFSAVSILTSLAMRGGTSLYAVLAWRYVLASLLLLAWVFSRAGQKPMPAAHALRWVGIGGGMLAFQVGLALSSLQWITPATLAFLFYTYPAWVALVQAVRGAEALDARRAAALALSLLGVALMAGTPGGGPDAWKGYALALGAALSYAIYIPTVARMQSGWPIVTTSAYASVGAAVCFVALALAQGTFTADLPAQARAAVVGLTLFSTILPTMFFLMALQRLSPVRMAIISTVEPFMTAVLGLVVLSQPLTAATMVGGALIAGAVILLQFRQE